MNPVKQILLILIVCLSSSCVNVFCEDHSNKEVIENINLVRREISTNFQTIVDLLRERESELLEILEEFEAKYETEQKERDENIEYLNNLRDTTESILEGSEMLKSLRHQHLEDIELKLNEIRFDSSKKYVSLSWNEDILNSVRNLGRIEIREKVRYSDKKNPILTVSRRGSADGELNYPKAIAIDTKSSKIFVADNDNHRVQVFDHECQYLYKFGENGVGKLKDPCGIAIGNDKVYVSQSRKSEVYSYESNGKFIAEFGNNELSNPKGLAVSERNGDIYVCDWDKHIIFVYSQDLQYKTSFGKDMLYHPRDIKLTQDRIFVLDEGNPCMHIFNRDLSYSHSIVSRGTGNDVGIGWFFTLDHEENILISDFGRNVVSVFNQKGELIHQIGNGSDLFYQPKGIAIDSRNRIVIVDNKEEGSLKIF